MRVTIGNTVLAPGGTSGPEQLEKDWEDELDIWHPAGEDGEGRSEPRIQNLGGRVTRVTFEVTREHANFQAAEEYWLTHERTLPRTGAVEIRSEGVGGRFSRIRLPQATLHAGNARIVGKATIHRYTITGAVAT